jgi:hypothetical protein
MTTQNSTGTPIETGTTSTTSSTTSADGTSIAYEA